jgi:hypothetical protein
MSWQDSEHALLKSQIRAKALLKFFSSAVVCKGALMNNSFGTSGALASKSKFFNRFCKKNTP